MTNLSKELRKIAQTIHKAIALSKTYYIGHAMNLDSPPKSIPIQSMLPPPEPVREITSIQAKSEEEALRKVAGLFPDYFYDYAPNDPEPTLLKANSVSYTVGSVKVINDAGYENFLCFGPNYAEVDKVLPKREDYIQELKSQTPAQEFLQKSEDPEEDPYGLQEYLKGKGWESKKTKRWKRYYLFELTPDDVIDSKTGKEKFKIYLTEDSNPERMANWIKKEYFLDNKQVEKVFDQGGIEVFSTSGSKNIVGVSTSLDDIKKWVEKYTGEEFSNIKKYDL